MLKYVTLAFLTLSTVAFADTKGAPMVSVPAIAADACPKGKLCVTPEQLQAFVNQQVEATKLNEQSNQPALKDVVTQYQKIMAERNPPTPAVDSNSTNSPTPLNPEPKK